MSTTDLDGSDTHDYSLVSGAGDTDNSAFSITGNQLVASNASTLSAGAKSVRIRTTDSANATYEKSFSITVEDDIKPDAPIITDPAEGDYTTATPTITGTAEPDSTVAITIDEGTPANETAGGSGNWSHTPAAALGQGAHTVSATATDAAGNVSDASATVSFMVDTVSPAQPTITAPADGATVTTKKPAITGTTEDGTTVTVALDGGTPQAATVNGSDWSYTPSAELSEGAHTVSVVAEDEADNASTPPATSSFTVDTLPPNVPSITAPADGTAMSNAQPIITIEADGADSVTVYFGGDEQGQATLDAGTTWTYTPATVLPDDTYVVTADASDAHGNTSAASAPVTFTVDTEKPDAPIITDPAEGDYTTGTPTITGTAEPDSTVAVVIDGGTAVDETADDSGNWSHTPATVLNQGSHTVSATATDAAGNVSDASATVIFMVDTEAPDASTITVPADGATVTTKQPTITGTTESGTTVTVTLDGGTPQAATVNGDSWSYTPSAELSEGAHTVSVVAEDEAGNASSPPATSSFTVDTLPPTLSLKGASEIELLLGASYDDAGASAEDARDGDLTNAIQVSGEVDTSTPGIYTLTYDVSDEAGNAAPILQRTVKVRPPAVTSEGGDNLVRVAEALPGAILSLYDADGDLVGETAQADAAGKHTFDRIAAGRGYVVTQTANGVESAASAPVQVTRPRNDAPATGGGASPPTGNVRVVDVALGDASGAVERVEIVRKVDASGQKLDTVVFDAAKAASVAGKAQSQGQPKAIILIDDLPDDPADEVNVTLPQSSVGILAEHKIALEIRSEEARVELPAESLAAMAEAGLTDLFFRLVPIRGEARQAIAQRTVTSEQVEAAAGGGMAQVFGTPMTIETNYSDFATRLVFPLPQIELPAQAVALQRLLDSLAVYIEHSDGEKKLQRGVIVYDDAGAPAGIEIEVSKFSTFTIVGLGEEESHVPYITGYPDGRFGPERIVTRAELAAMLSRLLGEVELRPEVDYRDLSGEHWAAGYIADMQALGLMQGYPDGSFRPDQTISRAELATVASRLLPVDAAAGVAVPDTTGHWAYEAIGRIVAAGLMQGYAGGEFRPDQGLTRAEAVTVLNRLFERAPLTGAGNPYTDVPAGHWAQGDILEASVAHAAADRHDAR
ncbi:S-layer homology domain-containing protein [Paenibacillus sp. IB182496]|uniref:S-layer homology domain-containing protein n=1 Tax=Paenibacillus sabuli TaxID=2772509 RepID=A0A927GPW5_9BACL|nr:Ig-like domain-containing protein [Paenibacillus sabuli]MBD2843899.1 S-layer homology domain-containing protein [Paenibacillus sabuli]